MTELLDRMLMEMELRNYSPHTINAYLWHVKAFEKLFGKSADELDEAEIRQYLYYLTTTKRVSSSNINIGYSALKVFVCSCSRTGLECEQAATCQEGEKAAVCFVLSRSEAAV